jgi:hypothetical protein
MPLKAKAQARGSCFEDGTAFAKRMDRDKGMVFRVLSFLKCDVLMISLKLYCGNITKVVLREWLSSLDSVAKVFSEYF